MEESDSRLRLFHTFGILFSMFCLGLQSASLGPTVVTMEVLLDTDTKHISTAFTGTGLGFLFGSIISGFIYDVINKDLLFALMGLGVAIASAAISYSSYLWEFVAISVIRGIFVALADGGANPYILTLWTGHKAKDSLLQAVHFTWAVGATVSPAIIKPFLTDLTTDQNSTSYLNGTSSEDLRQKAELVRIPYLIISGVVFVSAILWFGGFLATGPSLTDRNFVEEKRRGTSQSKHHKREKHFRIKILTFVFLFYFFYMWVVRIPGSLLPAFVVKGLGWSNERGALLMSVYWGANCTMRLVGVFVTLVLPVDRVLTVDLSLINLGFVLLMFAGYHPAVVWLAAALLGAGMATVYASGILWTEQYTKITGREIAVILVAVSSGKMTGVTLTGYLFDEFSHMYFVYILLTSSFTISCVFIGAVIFARKHKMTSQTEERYVINCQK